MSNEDFEAGRRIQQLKGQIEYIDYIINQSRDKEGMRKALLPILDDIFPEYYSIASKYDVEPSEIKNVSGVYEKIKGIKPNFNIP